MGDDYPRSGPSHSEAPDIVHFSSVDVDQARSVLNRFYYPVALGTPEGVADRFKQPYRHWLFVPTQRRLDETRVKPKKR